MAARKRQQPVRERVLIVEDTRSVRDFLVDYVLKPRGFEVIVATNGLDGLKLAAAHEPDLMIVDNQMPQLTGLELLKTLRDSGLEVPAILITAHGSERIAVEAFRLGIRDYVIKPFEVDTIDAAINRALRETRLERERDDLTHKLVDSNLRLQRRVQELNTLYGIGKSVSSSLELEDILHRVIEGAVYITSAEEGAMMLLDPTHGELYVRASKNLDADPESLRVPVKGSYAGESLDAHRPLILSADEPDHQAFLKQFGVKTMLYVPLVAHGQPLGVLSVANRYRDIPFTNRETRILSPLADYAAIAIRNAGLYAETAYERHKLQAILSQTADPILLLDEEGRMTMINAAARLALGIENGGGRLIDKLIDDKDLLAFLTQPPGPDFHPQTEVIVPDDRVFNAHMTLIEGVGRSIFMRDITQLKELDRLKTDLVSIVSHDLRSPLTSILGYIDLLSRVGPINENQEAFIARIKNSVGNITTLIGDLLDLGRLEAGIELMLTPCSLEEMLDELVEEMETAVSQKSQELKADIQSLPPILADRIRLNQAFSNLLSNAIKYTPQEGQIILRAYPQDGQAIVTITDTGVGIAPDEQQRVFDKFYRADNVSDEYQGTGLGLSIVKSVIEKHRGRVWVKSDLGHGSTFFVVLPTTTDASQRNSTANERGSGESTQ